MFVFKIVPTNNVYDGCALVAAYDEMQAKSVFLNGGIYTPDEWIDGECECKIIPLLEYIGKEPKLIFNKIY